MPSETTSHLPYKTLEAAPPKPLVTILLMMTMTVFLNTGKIDWIDKTAFTAAHMADFLRAHDYQGLFTSMFTSAFAQMSAWNWVLNAFFLWSFGYIVEKRVKTLKFACLAVVLVVSGWVLVFTQAGMNYSKMYIGPSLFLFGLLGAYFAFLPKREKRIEQWVKPSTQIYRNEVQQTTEERYFVSPWLYITLFVIYQVLLQVGLNFDSQTIVGRTGIQMLGQIHTAFFGRMQVVPSAFQPLAAIFNIAVGYALASALPQLVMSMKPKRPGGKLQLEVIQHYRELRTLDLTHEQACEGAAKFAAVPIDIAKDWIAKGAAGLKDQELR
jgi:membrane associated rhomboid family serine protease